VKLLRQKPRMARADLPADGRGVESAVKTAVCCAPTPPWADPRSIPARIPLRPQLSSVLNPGLPHGALCVSRCSIVLIHQPPPGARSPPVIVLDLSCRRGRRPLRRARGPVSATACWWGCASQGCRRVVRPISRLSTRTTRSLAIPSSGNGKRIGNLPASSSERLSGRFRSQWDPYPVTAVARARLRRRLRCGARLFNGHDLTSHCARTSGAVRRAFERKGRERIW